MAEPQATPFPPEERGNGGVQIQSADAIARIAAICRMGGRLPSAMQFRLGTVICRHIAPKIVIFVITITAAINHRCNNEFQEG